MLWALEKGGNRSSAPSFEDYKLAAIGGGGPIEIDSSNVIENCLGVIEVDIEQILRQQLIVGWYRLFTPDTYQSECDS